MNIANLTMPTPEERRLQKEEMQRRLKAVLRSPVNQVCSECPEPKPTWAVILQPPVEGGMKLGALCCFNCYSHHFRLGKGICTVKSANMAEEWTKEEVQILENSGNAMVNTIYEATLNDARAKQDLKSFVEEKYKNRNFFSEQVYHEQTTHPAGGRKSRRQTTSSSHASGIKDHRRRRGEQSPPSKPIRHSSGMTTRRGSGMTTRRSSGMTRRNSRFSDEKGPSGVQRTKSDKVHHKRFSNTKEHQGVQRTKSDNLCHGRISNSQDETGTKSDTVRRRRKSNSQDETATRPDNVRHRRMNQSQGMLEAEKMPDDGRHTKSIKRHYRHPKRGDEGLEDPDDHKKGSPRSRSRMKAVSAHARLSSRNLPVEETAPGSTQVDLQPMPSDDAKRSSSSSRSQSKETISESSPPRLKRRSSTHRRHKTNPLNDRSPATSSPDEKGNSDVIHPMSRRSFHESELPCRGLARQGSLRNLTLNASRLDRVEKTIATAIAVPDLEGRLSCNRASTENIKRRGSCPSALDLSSSTNNGGMEDIPTRYACALDLSSANNHTPGDPEDLSNRYDNVNEREGEEAQTLENYMRRYKQSRTLDDNPLEDAYSDPGDFQSRLKVDPLPLRAALESLETTIQPLIHHNDESHGPAPHEGGHGTTFWHAKLAPLANNDSPRVSPGASKSLLVGTSHTKDLSTSGCAA